MKEKGEMRFTPYPLLGKNSEKITKNYPSMSYVKVKNPKTELVISLEQYQILTFLKKLWNPDMSSTK